MSIVVAAGFKTIEFASSVNAFEFSNITTSNSQIPLVPLPPAILLLGSVIAGMGIFSAFRRRET